MFRTQHESNRQASNENELFDPRIRQMSGVFLVNQHHQQSLKLFDSLIEAGVCREQARGVLPQNLYTQYYGTANLGNLLKFVDLRIHEGAQWEIQEVAKAILTILEDLFPITAASYRESRHGETKGS
jgi:thymidylate synthase (FAD)